MSAPKPTYDWYVDAFGGTRGEDDFDSHLPLAVLEVADLCMGKNVPEHAETAYKAAICQMVDIYSEYGIGPNVGFSIGSFSMHSGGENVQQLARSRAAKILFPTGLLYSGIGSI